MNIRKNIILLVVLAITFVIIVTLPLLTRDKQMTSTLDTAKAVFINADNQEIGTAILKGSEDGVLIELDLSNLPKGTHAIHIHETGSCAPDFKAAGGHLNPLTKTHGTLSENPLHAGDLPNLIINDDGIVKLNVFNDRAVISPQKASESKAVLLDSDGAAFIIHAGVDDYITQPTGDAGGRIACAVITEL